MKKGLELCLKVESWKMATDDGNSDYIVSKKRILKDSICLDESYSDSFPNNKSDSNSACWRWTVQEYCRQHQEDSVLQ